jgi:predicted metal-dependent TIM-barrel fold hydrolase
MKLLFLDIDGVLNSHRSGLIYGYEKTIEHLDPMAIELVRYIVKETGCIICLSSDWRKWADYMELGKQLKLPILFETPQFDDDSRGEEIRDVVYSVQPANYAILDDHNNFMEVQQRHFVNVNDNDGLSYLNVIDCINILNEGDSDGKDENKD